MDNNLHVIILNFKSKIITGDLTVLEDAVILKEAFLKGEHIDGGNVNLCINNCIIHVVAEGDDASKSLLLQVLDIVPNSFAEMYQLTQEFSDVRDKSIEEKRAFVERVLDRPSVFDIIRLSNVNKFLNSLVGMTIDINDDELVIRLSEAISKP